MLDFPNSPSVGQTFASGNTTWTWDGTKWLAAGTTGASSIYLPLTGGTLTGPLTVSAPTSHIDNAIIGATTPAAASVTSLNGGPLAGMRNMLINGIGRIDQRNGNAGTTPAATGVTYFGDRWALYASQASKFTVYSGSSIGALPGGISTSVIAAVASAYTPVAADLFSIYQPIEGRNIARLGWGSSAAIPATLSFWAYASLAGTYCASFANSALNRCYLATFVLAANTWTKVAITIPGDTTGTWATDTTTGVGVRFCLGYGSNYVGTAGAWGSANVHAAAGSVNLVANASATFYVTGLQLEAGPVATPYEWLSYGAELALCERYYRTGQNFWGGQITSGSTVYTGASFEAMRAAPTVTLVNSLVAGFPAASGSAANIAANFFTEGRAANATSTQGFFGSNYTASAEL